MTAITFRKFLGAAMWLAVAGCSGATTGAIAQDPACNGRVAVPPDLLDKTGLSTIEQFVLGHGWVPDGTRIEVADSAGLPQSVNARQVQMLLLRRYPPALRDAGIGGTTVVRLLIDSSGRVARSTVVRGSGHVQLDSVALASIRDMRFRRPTHNGCALPVVDDVPVILTAR